MCLSHTAAGMRNQIDSLPYTAELNTSPGKPDDLRYSRLLPLKSDRVTLQVAFTVSRTRSLFWSIVIDQAALMVDSDRHNGTRQ
jgi:hypothetical protein